MQPGYILDRYCVRYLHPLLLKTNEKPSFLCLFSQNLPLFTIFCPVSIMHPCLPCLEYALATWKIIEVECDLNATLDSSYRQKYHQSFKFFILFSGFYSYSFQVAYGVILIYWEIFNFVWIKFHDIWPISRKLVLT